MPEHDYYDLSQYGFQGNYLFGLVCLFPSSISIVFIGLESNYGLFSVVISFANCPDTQRK